MAGGFFVPNFLVASQASGLQLISWVRDTRGCAATDLSAGQVKLADWLIANHAYAVFVEREGFDIDAVLTGLAVPDGALVVRPLYNEPVRIAEAADWHQPYSAGDTACLQAQTPAEGDAGEEKAPPAPASPHAASRGAIVEVAAGASSPIFAIDPLPVGWVLRGKLGETPSGPLFTVAYDDRAGPHRFILEGMGLAWAMDRGQATSACAALAEALGLRVERR